MTEHKIEDRESGIESQQGQNRVHTGSGSTYRESRVNPSDRGDAHEHPSNGEVEKAWSSTATYLYVFLL